MRLDVSRSRELSAVVAALATVPREVARQVAAQSKQVIGPEWKKALAEHAPERIFHQRLVAPASVNVRDRGVKLIAGKNGDFVRETEFGAYREEFNTYRRKGRKVTRRTQRQFWHYTKTGHVVYPTAREIIPRVGALWVQTALRTIHETLEEAL